MYDLIFEYRIQTFLIATFLTILVCFVLGKPKDWWRTMLYCLSPSFACAYYLVVVVYGESVNYPDVLSLMFLELVILLLYIKIFCKCRDMLSSLTLKTTNKHLFLLLIIGLFVSTSIFTFGNVGILSDDSRIDFMNTNKLAKYITYLSFIIATVQAGLISRKITLRSIDSLVFLCVAGQLIFSIMLGSKGFVFLWLASVISLVDFKKAKLTLMHIIYFIFFSVLSLFTVAKAISNYLSITMSDFFNLAFNRFFLFNDARGLSLDLRSNNSYLEDFLRESFRVVSNFLGYLPEDPPLGNLLFQQYFMIFNGDGSNASLAALITYYSNNYVAIYYVGAFTIIISTVYFFVAKLGKYFINNNLHYAAMLLSLLLVTNLSQDFLTFQLLLILYFFLMILAYFASAFRR